MFAKKIKKRPFDKNLKNVGKESAIARKHRYLERAAVGKKGEKFRKGGKNMYRNFVGILPEKKTLAPGVQR